MNTADTEKCFNLDSDPRAAAAFERLSRVVLDTWVAVLACPLKKEAPSGARTDGAAASVVASANAERTSAPA